MDVTTLSVSELKTLINRAQGQLKAKRTEIKQAKFDDRVAAKVAREAQSRMKAKLREDKKLENTKKAEERLARLEAKLAKLKAEATPATAKALRAKGAAA